MSTASVRRCRGRPRARPDRLAAIHAAGAVGPIASPPSTPPVGPNRLAAIDASAWTVAAASALDVDPIDRSQLVNVSSEYLRSSSRGSSTTVRTHQSTVNVQVTNTSATAIPTPLILVIESISDPTVTVANADGIVTPDGASFFNLTGQVPGSTFDPGETTSNRPAGVQQPVAAYVHDHDERELRDHHSRHADRHPQPADRRAGPPADRDRRRRHTDPAAPGGVVLTVERERDRPGHGQPGAVSGGQRQPRGRVLTEPAGRPRRPPSRPAAAPTTSPRSSSGAIRRTPAPTRAT